MDFTLENEIYLLGFESVAGVDEAGRGPLAGDVFAAAVILPKDFILEGLNDSKKLSEKKRERLFNEITHCSIFGIGRASAEEIDRINILNAAFLAMRRAIEALSQTPDFVLVDGNINIREMNLPQKSVIKGDALSPSIAAASILAKVSRDRYMKDLALLYPGYGFEKHKGYGTKEHYAAINGLGVCIEHRKTFLKNIAAAGGEK